MEELFVNIPEKMKEQVKFIFDIALRQKSIDKMAKIFNEYISKCQNEEQREFAEFYFNMRMEQLKNGNFSN